HGTTGRAQGVGLAVRQPLAERRVAVERRVTAAAVGVDDEGEGEVLLPGGRLDVGHQRAGRDARVDVRGGVPGGEARPRVDRGVGGEVRHDQYGRGRKGDGRRDGDFLAEGSCHGCAYTPLGEGGRAR